MQTVTLRGDDFRTIHNTLCELRSIVRDMEQSMVKVERLESVVAQFEQGLADAYEQDNSAFDKKFEYYRRFKQDNQLFAIWSIYEIDALGGFMEDHPYPSDSFVVYDGQHCAVPGPTWGDIYRAADTCIRNSGDSHHMFIESFELKNGNELYLSTGS